MEAITVRDVTFPECEKWGLSPAKFLEMFRKMLAIRLFEEKVEELFLVRGVLVGPSHLYLGQEAVAVGVLLALREGDLMVTTYRCHGHAIAKGIPMKLVMAELFGKSEGTCKGLGGSMHASIYPEKGSIYATAIVGSGIPIAAGMGLGLKYKKKDEVVICFFGDGAVNSGAFHEGLNIASIWRVPTIFVCENNVYAMSTRVDRAVSSKSIADRALSYSVETAVVDGNDVMAVYSATKQAEEKLRRGQGPYFLECRTYKRKGHGVYDNAEYRPKDEVDMWLKMDPIERARQVIKQEGMATEGELRRIEREIMDEVKASVKFAEESPILPFSELEGLVYA